MTLAKHLLTPLLFILLAPGCSTLQSAFSSDPGPLTYGADAAANLKFGNDALDSKNFIEAERYFEYVRVKYPFLDAANEAELRLADTEFEKEQYASARDKYQSFMKLHPTHGRVDYAAFRAALTHYKDIPSDLFILPPSFEKDQVEVTNALRAMNDFVKAFPNSKYTSEAKKIINDSRRRLAEHELYVADFYAAREKWPAVVSRLNGVVQDFQGLGLEERALLGLYDAYTQLKDDVRAKETLRAIIAKLPGTKAAERAQKLLGS